MEFESVKVNMPVIITKSGIYEERKGKIEEIYPAGMYAFQPLFKIRYGEYNTGIFQIWEFEIDEDLENEIRVDDESQCLDCLHDFSECTCDN